MIIQDRKTGKNKKDTKTHNDDDEEEEDKKRSF